MTSRMQLSTHLGPPPEMARVCLSLIARISSGEDSPSPKTCASGLGVGREERRVTSPANSVIGVGTIPGASAGRLVTLPARAFSTSDARDSPMTDPPPLPPPRDGVAGYSRDSGDTSRVFIFLRSGASSSDSYLSEPAAGRAGGVSFAGAASALARRSAARGLSVSLTKV